MSKRFRRRYQYYAIRDGEFTAFNPNWNIAWDIIEARRKFGGKPEWKGCYNMKEVETFFKSGHRWSKDNPNSTYNELMDAYLASNGKNKTIERRLEELAREKIG